MDDRARTALQRLITTYGLGLAQDQRALGSMLTHECPGLPIEVDVIVAASRVGVPEALARSARVRPDNGLVGELAGQVAHASGFTPAEAAWAIQSWAAALGVMLPPPAPARASAPTPPPMPSPAPVAVAAPAPPVEVVVIRERHAPPRPAPRRRRRSRAEITGLVAAVIAGVAIVGAALAVGGHSGRRNTGPAAVVPREWVVYVDKQTGFRMSYPPTWIVENYETAVDFRDPVTRAYLRVDYREATEMTPVDGWLEYEPQFARQYPTYKRIGITPASYHGRDAALWEYTYGDGDTANHAYNLGFFTGGYGFALNFQTRTVDWERLRPMFETFKAAFHAP